MEKGGKKGRRVTVLKNRKEEKSAADIEKSWAHLQVCRGALDSGKR